MRNLFTVCTVLTALTLLIMMPSPALAICTGISEPLQHALGGFFTNCPDKFPVAAFAYGLNGTTSANNQAAVNTGSVNIACTDSSAANAQGGLCQVEAGTPGDGNVTISFDWGGAGTFLGCPNSALAPNTGRNVLQLVANDGSSLLVTVGFSFDLGQYAVDFAEQVGPVGPTGTPTALPLSCKTSEAGLTITQQTASPTSYTVSVHVPAPLMHTDCDAGTWGATGGGIGFTPTCDSTVPTTAPGRVYTTTFACGQSPDPRLTGGPQTWTATAVQPDTSGNAAGITINRPTSPPTGPPQCAFLGASGLVSTVETLAVMGAIEVQGQGAPSPKALGVTASRSGGNVVVSFRTDSEIELAGFNILADVQGGKNRIQVNSQMIAPKGVSGAGASYTVSIPGGNLKGAKTIYVESVTTSGAKILSDPARL